jgi:hypothetical protein
MRNKNRSLTFRHNTDATFDAKLDGERLSRQAGNVAFAMRSGHWRTLREISKESGAPEASASARLRDLRKRGCIVDIRRRGDPRAGLWEYRVTF